jgi:D-arabinose 1-dehydrogenase-like Zn-dependent alcohol dehydrogenase
MVALPVLRTTGWYGQIHAHSFVAVTVLLSQEMLEFCADKDIAPMVQTMKLSEVGAMARP